MGLIEIDTYYMFENMNYELKLVVIKGDRISISYQSLQIAVGNPPQMEIRYVPLRAYYFRSGSRDVNLGGGGGFLPSF